MKSRESILEGFLAARFKEGQPISHSYFWELFGLQEPRGAIDVEFLDKIKLRFMTCMEGLRNDLLDKHFLDLQNMRGQGYYLVPYQDRITVAEKDTRKVLSKEIRRAIRRMTKIKDPENLSYTQQRQRDYALQTYEALRRDLHARPRYPKS